MSEDVAAGAVAPIGDEAVARGVTDGATAPRREDQSLLIGRILLGLVAFVCFLVLGGWFFNVSMLKRAFFAPSAIPSSTALSLFVLCVFSFVDTLLNRNGLRPYVLRWYCLFPGAVLFLAGAATIAESFMGAEWGLQFPIGPQPEEVRGITFPGPMAPNVALSLMLLSASMLFPHKVLKGKSVGEATALIVLIGALSALMGHAFGVEFMCTIVGCIKIPLVSSAMLGAVAIGFMLVHPERGMMTMLCAANASGTHARKLCGALLSIPVALAARSFAISSGLIDQNFGWFLFGGFMLFLLWKTIGVSAQGIAQIDDQKAEVEKKLQASSAALSELYRSKMDVVKPPARLKKICLTCAATYSPEMEFCTEDGEPLSAVSDDSLVGEVFAERYLVTEYIGRGGMCAVYKVQHVYMLKIFALKVLLGHLASDPAAIKRFQREAKAASLLSHPNLLSVNDFGITEQGQAFIVMEFVEGQSLDEFLSLHKRLQVNQFIDLSIQICEGLQHAHETGVVHRDLKPSNIMLREVDGKCVVQIVDFGLARIIEEGAAGKITATSQVVGSPVYLSPEQYSDYELGPHADIYSLGCMMYELLDGEPPLVGMSLTETVQKHMFVEPKPFREELRIPAELEGLILSMLAKDPKDRPPINGVLEMLNSLKSTVRSAPPR